MTSLETGTSKHAQRLIAIIALLASIALATVSPAAAQDAERVELGVKPVSVDGSYFELTMSPGEARQLTVEFGNFGTRDAVAMTYPADVYSLVNGGMGVRLAGESTSGTTGWIGFAAETFPLAAGEARLRTFAVSVPEDAAPGEYLSSVVIQDATPPATSGNNGVVANRVNRQAIAVAITVPGPVTPGLTLGSVAHHVAGGRSILTVEVHNSGNVRLQPRGELILTSPNGETARFAVAMDSVYAGTSTVAEIPFTTLLVPGEYSVVLTLSDTSHDITVTTGTMPLSIPASNLQVAPPVSPNTATVAQPATSNASEDGRLPLVPSLAIAAVVLALGGCVVAQRAWPRRASRPVATTSRPATPPPHTIARPVTIRQLAVPRRSEPSPTPEQPRPALPRFKKLDFPTADSRLAAAGSHAKGA